MKSAIIKRVPVVGLIYLVLSLLYFGTVGNYGRMYLGYGLDPISFIWFLNWWPWAIAHGLSPFISYYVVSARVQYDLGDLVACTRAECLDGFSLGLIPGARQARVVHWRIPLRLLGL